MDEGGVLNSIVKKLIPDHELPVYFLEIARQRKADTLQEFYEFIESKRVALKLASIHLENETSKMFFSDSNQSQERCCNNSDEVFATQGGHPDTCRVQVNHAGPSTSSAPHHVGSNSSKVEAKEDVAKKVSFESSKPKEKCSFCDTDHQLWQCEKFKMLELSHKYVHIKNNRLCYHCLGGGHRARDCKFFTDRKCGLQRCDKYHHHLLHNFQDGDRVLLSVEMFLAYETAEQVDDDVPVICNHVQTAFAEREDYCAIRTATVILSCNGKKRRVVVAMDPCSNSTNIDADFAREMNLVVEKTGIEREINFLERKAVISSEIVSFMLSPLNSDVQFPVRAFTIKDLVSGTPVIDWSKVANEYPHLRAAEIPKPDPRDKVQILLGTDYAHLNGTMHGIIGRDFEPIAEFTKLGWAFSGRVKNCQILNGSTSQFGIATARSLSFCTFVNRVDVSSLKSSCEKDTGAFVLEGSRMSSHHVGEEIEIGFETGCELTQRNSSYHTRGEQWVENQTGQQKFESGLSVYLSIEPNIQEDFHELDELVKKNWELEAVGLIEKVPRFSGDIKERSQKQWTRAERLSDEKLAVVYLPELRQFQVSIPWKDVRPNFRSNRAAVKARQDKVCERLGPRLDKAREIFKGYLDKEYVRKLDPHEIYEQHCLYLPFFCVIREDSPSTPIRIVWDCAATYNGKSLNSEVESTPNRLQDLFKILLRMRKFPYVVTSDISEMFSQSPIGSKRQALSSFRV
jgi:hypothetical protein